jgi:hypothetical protein
MKKSVEAQPCRQSSGDFAKAALIPCAD